MEPIQLPVMTAAITAHAFNHTRQQVAVCMAGSNDVQIYERANTQASQDWRLIHTLRGHDKLVTGIDWAPSTNRLVTCSQDRNAYVWQWDDAAGQWRPTLVLLRINRAATCVRWSPRENKFAVASGARCVAICHFESENDWWVSKHLKRPIRSTVLSLDWHPNNVLLAAGCADMKVRVFSAYIKGVDEKPAASPWGERLPFNTLCAEYVNNNGGWVHGVAFSPDGNAVAWVGHDSSVSVADPSVDPTRVFTAKLPLLPFTSLLWVTPQLLVAVGHDCVPVLVTYAANTGVRFVEKLDLPEQQQKGGRGAPVGSAMNKFKQLDSRAQTQDQASTELGTLHQNTITSIRFYLGAGREAVRKFSTSGVDGKLVVWDLQTLLQSGGVASALSAAGMAGLRI